jgi:hypothetical protein
MSCGRKRQYRSRKLALSVAARCSARRGVTIRAYKCLGCHRWHLTSMPLLSP